jgi:hypothetical protein
MSTWHAPPDDLRRYADGSADVATAASVEAHVIRCGACAAALSPGAERLDALWAGVVDRLDRPRRTFVERLLLALHVGESDARLLAATPSLQASWLLALVVVLVVAVAVSGSANAASPLVLLAPLLPVAGVAAAYGPQFDPAYEVSVAAPYSAVRLLLLRASAVLVTSCVLAGGAALLRPDAALTAAWLLPALGLTVTTLALSTWWDPILAGTTVAIGWVAVMFELARDHDLAEVGTAGMQLACLALTVAGVLVLVRRYRTFDLGRPS